MRALLGSLVAAGAAVAGATAQGAPAIDTLAIKAHTHFLAHDQLRGRGTGSEGALTAALYIASVCRALGLEPVGEDFHLPLPLEAARVGVGTRLEAWSGSERFRFPYPRAVLPNVGSASTLVGFQGQAVFVGAEETIGRGGLVGLDLRGAVAVTWGPVGAAAVDSLRARGATAVVHLVGTPESFALYARTRGLDRYYHRDTTVQSSFLPRLPSVLAGPAVARLLLADIVHGDSLPNSQPLRWQLSAHLDLARRPVNEANVACLARASGLAADTAVVFTAHYDHLGVSAPDEAGDSIYNGFSDNAAAVGMLLAIASRSTAASLPRYSRIFLFLSGEERGLLGSDYFVAHPAWPLERIRAVINLDAGAPPAAPVRWRLAGVDSTGLGAVAIAAAGARGWTVSTSPARANSDHYPFIREGVPGVFIIPGPLPYEGMTTEASQSLKDRWDRYHQAGDAWAEDFPFGGLERYAAFALAIATALDRGP
ncbi:MAG: M28 family peptidase [Gemmatimonadales bacterium]|jgi:hypothetical protein